MVLERLKQVAQHVAGSLPPPHPLDPLSAAEIEAATAIIRLEHPSLFYNAVTLQEPRKAAMQAWLADPEHVLRPHRVADVVAVGKGSKVYDGLVDLEDRKVLSWEVVDGVQPLVSPSSRYAELEAESSDHHGRPADRGTCGEEGSQGH